VTDLDLASRAAVAALPGGPERAVPYDRLLLAAGSRLQRPAVPGADCHVWSVDTYEEAVALEAHLRGLRSTPECPGRYTVVVVGAGFTGIEVAAEMVGRLREVAVGEGAEPRVVLVERAPVVGPDLGEKPRPVIEEALATLGVEVRLGTTVSALDAEGVTLRGGERLAAGTVVWATGLRANPLAARLGVATDRLGRVPVDEALQVQGLPDVFAAGDVAQAVAEAAHPTLMSCQHALSMGRLAGANVARSLLGRPLEPYAPPPYVTCLDLGAWGALLTRGWAREPVKVGAEAKAVKRAINTELIYPPRSGDRREILEAALGNGRRRLG
jgi:NADH dehydrogenase